MEKVELRETYEHLIWSYLSTTVSDSVQEYQVEAQHPTLSRSSPLTSYSPEELGDLLVKAVETMHGTHRGKDISCINYNLTSHIPGVPLTLHFDNILQILHFMRIDRKVTARGHSSPKPCISFVIKDLCDALSTKGIEISHSHFSRNIQHLPINTTNPQWFLKAESDLDYIPYSKAGLSLHGHQKKCCNILKSIFSEEVLSALDKGTCIFS